METSTRPRIVIVTDPAMPELQPDDRELPAAFEALGVEAVVHPWGEPLPEPSCAAALIRTPWEYFKDPERFLGWVEALEVPVVNSAEVLRWNHDKRYLLELSAAGVARIPATALVGEGELLLGDDALLDRIERDRAVLKPTVSGGAWRTVVLERGASHLGSLGDQAHGDFLVQDFVEELPVAGEWSLTFLGGAFSHAVRKRARSGDFRVQEEHGGTVEFLSPPPELLGEAREILSSVPGGAPLAYGRVDLVEASEGRPYLMELELIEPELFLRAQPGAVSVFAASVLDAVGGLASADQP